MTERLCSHGWPALGCSDHGATEASVSEAADRLREAFDWIDTDRYESDDLRAIAAVALGATLDDSARARHSGLGWAE